MVRLVDENEFYEPIDTNFEVGESEKMLLHVYDGYYILKISSLWFKEQNKKTNVRSNAPVTAPIEFLEIADSNNDDIEGSWSETPKYIFDGGN